MYKQQKFNYRLVYLIPGFLLFAGSFFEVNEKNENEGEIL